MKKHIVYWPNYIIYLLNYISFFTLKEDHGHGDGHYHGDGHGHDEVSFVKAVYLIFNIEEESNCLYA